MSDTPLADFAGALFAEDARQHAAKDAEIVRLKAQGAASERVLDGIRAWLTADSRPYDSVHSPIIEAALAELDRLQAVPPAHGR